MENKNVDFVIFAIVLLYYCIYSHGKHVGKSPDPVDRNKKKINDYILGLEFDRQEVLSYYATGSTNPVPKEGHLSENEFTVITRTHKTVSNGGSNIGVVTTNQHRAFPGSLLLANSRLTDNAPDPVYIPRAPMEYGVNLPGFDEGESNFTIIPNFIRYESALSHAIETWFKKHPNYDVPAIFTSEHTFVHSKEQLRVRMGVEFKKSEIEANVDFESAMKNEKTIMIAKFKQIFYTVGALSPMEPADLFDSKVTVNEVRRKMTAKEPPVMVDTVSYGRLIYVMIETTSTSDSTKTALETQFGNLGGVKNNNVKKNALENLRIRVYGMGGGADHVKLIKAKTFEEIQDVLVETSRFSRENLGFPVSYSTEFINDHTRAIVQGTAEYTETKTEVFKNGFLKLEHLGVYIARFYVNWKEIHFDADGKINSTTKQWHGNDIDRSIYWTGMIQFPGNAREIDVTIMGATGLAWEPWRTSVERKNIPLLPKRRITIWGTTLNQQSEIVPEQWE